MTPCPHCSRESDRLAPLLEQRLVEVNKALGLGPFALHEERMARLRVLVEAAESVGAWDRSWREARALGGEFKLRLAESDAKRAMLAALSQLRTTMERAAAPPDAWTCSAT
jgi:hypothetical protein